MTFTPLYDDYRGGCVPDLYAASAENTWARLGRNSTHETTQKTEKRNKKIKTLYLETVIEYIRNTLTLYIHHTKIFEF